MFDANIRPQSGRLPYYNAAVSTEGQEHVPSVVGPMTRSFASLLDVTRLTIDAKPWTLDPRCICMPWRSDMYEDMLSRPLTVGLILDDGKVRVHPPIERALKHLVEKLRQRGHDVVEWDTAGHVECINVQVRHASVPVFYPGVYVN